jgi:hypothetical protein
MKVLFDHDLPFLLAHGGLQIQIEQTKAALEAAGVTVEHLRWWDPAQSGNIIHFFGRAPESYISFAHQKGMRIVMAELLSGLGSRSAAARALQRIFMRLAQGGLPAAFVSRMAWRSYTTADALIANTPWEARLMTEMFDAPPARVACVPNGVEPVFLDSAPAARGPWLVCTATITRRKRVLELAEAAVLARTPLRVIGQPYAAGDPYAKQFERLVREQPGLLRHEGALADRAALARAYREARGFALLSTVETRSLSAEEAAACGCPLLLSDLPWARSVFGTQASYCPPQASSRRIATCLRAFYDAAPTLPPPPKPKSWRELAPQFIAVYERVLSTSR